MNYAFKFALAFIFTLITIASQAQTTTTSTSQVTGSVTDAEGKPLASVTISLLAVKDSSLAKLGVSDANGAFELNGIRQGAYFVSYSAVGFGKVSSAPFTVNESPVQVPAIKLSASSTDIAAVTVRATRPLVEARLDKMVVNVDASPTNAGATALEVLEKSPGISVDRDGNISLKGKQGVVVYMDGKQTYLSGADLANLLRNMPASQLDQIEIMTQPSAKYDAAGNAGILNLRTKKNIAMGLNGTISLSYVQGKFPKSPNSFSINYRRNKFNIFGNLNYSYWRNESNQTLNRKFKNTAGQDTSVFYQENTEGNSNHNLNGRIGVDYSIDPKTSIGFFVNATYNKNAEYANSIGYIYNNGALASTLEAHSTNDRPVTNFTSNVNFRKQLAKQGQELSADLDYIHYFAETDQHSNNYPFDPVQGAGVPYLLRAMLPSDIQILSGKVDYSHPLSKAMKIETGFKSSRIRTDNNAPYESYNHVLGKWVDDKRKDHFTYEENIQAGYLNFSTQGAKWGVQAGLRAEYTTSKGTQVLKGTSITRDYLELFPTFYTSYSMNDKNQFVLSYGRRLDRPNYRDLNPFQDFLDSFTYSQGNPYLLPQFTHNIELSHNYMGRLNTTLNYTSTVDIMNDILKQNDSTKVTYQTKENVARRTNIGIAISYNAPITKWWTTSFYVNVFNNHYKGIVNGGPLDVSITSLMANMSQVFKFGKGWTAEMNGFFRTRTQETGMFLIEPLGVLSFGASKLIMNNKGTLKLSVVDPFELQHTNVFVKYGNIDMYVTNRWDNRRVALTFTYRFSKGQAVQQRKRAGSAQEEQNRIGS